MLTFVREVVVLAAKRNDRHFRLLVRHAAHTVAMQSRAVDHKPRAISAAIRFDNGFAGSRPDPSDRSPCVHRAALLSNQLGILLAHRRIVGDSRARNMEPSYTAAIWLDVSQFFFLQQPQP